MFPATPPAGENIKSMASGLQTVAAREAALLAPYALASAASSGRKYPEPEHPYRSPFQRDRDRIVHSAAYRRLSGKTQVFTGEMGDYHRTRLTHTHEVASIARTIGRALRLNEDLIEALALFHDIGHPPFGHAGEDALDECLADDGGFSHNRYALTLAEELETRYPQFSGLNLTREVLDGQATRVDKSAVSANMVGDALVPLLEVQVVDLADSITYDAHDTDDAIKLGLVSLEQILEVPLVRAAAERVRTRYDTREGKMLRLSIIHELIDEQVSDVLLHNGPALADSGFTSSLAARQAGFCIRTSSPLAGNKRELETFLYEHVYRHPRLIEVRAHAQQRLRAMFRGYVARPELLPARFQARAATVGVARSTGDYLAGMTDRFCDQQFQQLFAGTHGV